ncbi:hypothetical protein B0H16DRAFT_1570291 [Mycena metata]|uniref:Uncharacterized protein n=1 Tax=Mycena metata TaxID=1033252 RepID=A0AAD7IC08_9AGAR|nr:hypothetical protein B0H16DRAFT_1570291 [Mycena metata]
MVGDAGKGKGCRASRIRVWAGSLLVRAATPLVGSPAFVEGSSANADAGGGAMRRASGLRRGAYLGARFVCREVRSSFFIDGEGFWAWCRRRRLDFFHASSFSADGRTICCVPTAVFLYICCFASLTHCIHGRHPFRGSISFSSTNPSYCGIHLLTVFSVDFPSQRAAPAPSTLRRAATMPPSTVPIPVMSRWRNDSPRTSAPNMYSSRTLSSDSNTQRRGGYRRCRLHCLWGKARRPLFYPRRRLRAPFALRALVLLTDTSASFLPPTFATAPPPHPRAPSSRASPISRCPPCASPSR